MAARPKDAGQVAPIIIKRVKKHAHGHHGGSWKVAFADFATAMMAFFLLLWLMGSTTEEQKGAISEYFQNPSAVPGTSTVPSPTSIQGPGGASTSMIQLGGGMELHRTATAETQPADPADAEKLAEELDKERLEGLLSQLRDAIDQRESLAQFKDQILLDVTPEGVRIQIIDHERRSMFPLGSPVLEPFADNILRELTTIIDNVPNRISISGHTDIRPYGRVNYSNWELSADRANAARRSLIGGGLTPEKIGRVVGLASSVLLDPQIPDSPINRRISIVVMNKRTEDAINHENGSLLSVQDNQQGGAATAEGEPVAAVAPEAAQ
ncbi:chemotaxis protein MotB [Povalibacter uvarum]|uniref:Chemotaxis protein MotB n=1 Tax=Povalibacter uvarum TaxID=732238 RepID=A0A841HPH9_9GAMM|nr:flagellar motor protein MotB [Povalibacter uvarum]MBB6094544.1 chemotaxis protein MotB [Povalibacter uvarum]